MGTDHMIECSNEDCHFWMWTDNTGSAVCPACGRMNHDKKKKERYENGQMGQED